MRPIRSNRSFPAFFSFPLTRTGVADFGYQHDSYQLHILKSNVVDAGRWTRGPAGTLVNGAGGKTQLRSGYAQDAWAYAPKWKNVLGTRIEHRKASHRFTRFGAGNAANTGYAARIESFVSPKAALSNQWTSDTVLKASTGRAVRFPTVGELYRVTAPFNFRYLNESNLQPEKSWPTNLTVEKNLGNVLLRFTLFIRPS